MTNPKTMKAIKYISLFALICLLPACVDDEGNYSYTDVNEIKVEGIEERYTGMAYRDVIDIVPEVSGSLFGSDVSTLYEYTWYRCFSNHTHEVIGTEKDLHWQANVSPGTHTLFLSVKDTKTGYEKRFRTSVVLSSPFTRGFLILGNRPHTDNLVGLDMLTIIEGKNDTIYAKDVFDNSEVGIKNAKALIHTGNRTNNRFYLQTEDATYNPVFTTDFETLGKEFNEMDLVECMEPHKTPMKLMDVGMKQGVHTQNSLSVLPRVYLTEDLAFVHKVQEKVTQPVNRYSISSNQYFKFYPYIFYNTRKNLSYPAADSQELKSPIVLYDTDHDCFCYVDGDANTYIRGYCTEIYNTKTLTGNNIYMTNQPNGRTIVYGENDYSRSRGRCNVIMKDNDDKYFLYRFTLRYPRMGGAQPAPTIDDPYGCELNTAEMTGFLQREHIFFASSTTQIYYSVGNTLYIYDYVSKKLGTKVFNGNITYLAPEVCSIPNEISHYWVATFDGDKGHLYKMKVVDNPNQIEFMELPNQNWEIDLEIKSVLWKETEFYQNIQ